MSPDRQRRRVLLKVLAAVAAVVLFAQISEVFEEAELPTIDARFRLRGSEDPPPDLVVIGIDDVTLQEIDESYPLPLGLHARAIDALTDAGAVAIVLDVTTSSDDRDPAFLASLADAPSVTLSAVRSESDGTPVVLGGAGALEIPGVRAANGRFEPDDDGVVRRFDHTMHGDDDDDGTTGAAGLAQLPTLPVVAVEQVTGEELSNDVTGSEGATIDLPGPTGTVEQVSFLSLVNGTVPPEQIAGKIAIVGPTAQELQDTVQTSLSENTSRAELHADAIQTLNDDVPLRTPPPAVQLLLTLLACVAPLLAARQAALRGVVLVCALALGWLVVAQVAFNLGSILPVVAPIVGLIGAAAAAIGVNYAFEVRARRQVREVFGRFVPPDVVRDIVDADPNGDLLRATSREVTVLFSDLRGFTTFSEQRDPQEVVGILNDYLAVVTDVLVDADAVIDYLGDGVMAVFGVPAVQSDHASRALAAGVEILEATERFDREMTDRLDGAHFRVGVGINSGTVTAGNLGTVRRLKYTVIGDAVNTAARIEGLTKDAPYDLLMADATRVLLSSEPDDLVEHATLPIRGRSKSVRLWSLSRATSTAATLGNA
ncbi:CHASE2 domain-containing protein [Ilumatobacter nonamiensis]|uniref:CHASE2 domain-containing protein n=1 Tax=Ilumatobacter nonamiensis TaxID=467093 RepID=UPI00034AF334|nr:adenylate/guanylate cyclase domain-containing protein [Ilumatobacter nonamiensis]